MTDLGTLGSTSSAAVGINNAGQVVGWSRTHTPFEEHAFLYNSSSGGPMTDLGTLGGTWSRAYDINNAGQVVGASATASGPQRAFLYDSGSGMVDLNTLIDPGAGWTLVEARDINDHGWIVGWGYRNGATRAFLLTPISPVPVPASLVLMPSGLAMLALLPRRRAAWRGVFTSHAGRTQFLQESGQNPAWILKAISQEYV